MKLHVAAQADIADFAVSQEQEAQAFGDSHRELQCSGDPKASNDAEDPETVAAKAKKGTKGRNRRITEELVLKRMATVEAALQRIISDGGSSNVDVVMRLCAATRALADRMEDAAEAAASEGGLKGQGKGLGLRNETLRLKRKVARLKETKRALKKQVREAQEAIEKREQELHERTVCMICHDLPRDTFVLPCLHFFYCFSCLSKHSSTNNSCPSCRRTILGLCKASSLSNP
ncbi:hypothetical protein KP509_17G015400 [Ceratopteris richardii]|uniref:RING-type domain-containing protein n=1 Tax=Ceratopteris richardii TaxID=49495 RepID=A0A8T2SUN9_CERRI|nr:hypothetical protein KP509_17G015400 [Ceratopteris richardii]